MVTVREDRRLRKLGSFRGGGGGHFPSKRERGGKHASDSHEMCDGDGRRTTRLAVERGWFPTDQLGHPANPRVHEVSTGPEIVAQCGAQLSAFVCAVGTGGSITGVVRHLKTHVPGTMIILAARGNVREVVVILADSWERYFSTP